MPTLDEFNEILENTFHPTLHLIVNDEEHNIEISQLDIGSESSEAEIKAAVEEELGLRDGKLNNLVVTKEPNGNITIHPNPVYG